MFSFLLQRNAISITKANAAKPAARKYKNPGSEATVSAYTSDMTEFEISCAMATTTPITVNIFPYSVRSTIFEASERNGVVCNPPNTVKAAE